VLLPDPARARPSKHLTTCHHASLGQMAEGFQIHPTLHSQQVLKNGPGARPHWDVASAVCATLSEGRRQHGRTTSRKRSHDPAIQGFEPPGKRRAHKIKVRHLAARCRHPVPTATNTRKRCAPFRAPIPARPLWLDLMCQRLELVEGTIADTP